VSPVRNMHDYQLFRSSSVDQFIITKAQRLPLGQFPMKKKVYAREPRNAQYSPAKDKHEFRIIFKS
jgi:hypothetical protein